MSEGSFTALTAPAVQASAFVRPHPSSVPSDEGLLDGRFVGPAPPLLPSFRNVGAHTPLYNAIKGKRERVSHILKMHANKREEISEIYCGDIAAIPLKMATTGDTLCDEEHAITLESIEPPQTVVSVAIEPKTQADQGKLFESLH